MVRRHAMSADTPVRMRRMCPKPEPVPAGSSCSPFATSKMLEVAMLPRVPLCFCRVYRMIQGLPKTSRVVLFVFCE